MILPFPIAPDAPAAAAAESELGPLLRLTAQPGPVAAPNPPPRLLLERALQLEPNMPLVTAPKPPPKVLPNTAAELVLRVLLAPEPGFGTLPGT